MKYAVITNGLHNNTIWYGTYEELDTARTVAEKVSGKIVIFES